MIKKIKNFINTNILFWEKRVEFNYRPGFMDIDRVKVEKFYMINIITGQRVDLDTCIAYDTFTQRTVYLALKMYDKL